MALLGVQVAGGCAIRESVNKVLRAEMMQGSEQLIGKSE